MGMDWSNPVVGVIVGGVDEGMQAWDEKSVPARTQPFQNAVDISRIIECLGGYGLATFMPRYSKMGTQVGLASTALLMKSVVQALKSTMNTTAARRAGYAPHARPAYGPMPVAQTTPPLFEGERTY